MKKIIVIILILVQINVYSQEIRNYIKDNWKEISLMYISGACDGQVETLSHHYSDFKRVFPNSNDNYWNPSISWKNKYLNNDYMQGSKFPLSTNMLVWTTDAYHLFKAGQKASFIGGVTIKIGEKKKFKYYLIDFAVYSASYGAGFYTTYNLIY